MSRKKLIQLRNSLMAEQRLQKDIPDRPAQIVLDRIRTGLSNSNFWNAWILISEALDYPVFIGQKCLGVEEFKLLLEQKCTNEMYKLISYGLKSSIFVFQIKGHISNPFTVYAWSHTAKMCFMNFQRFTKQF